MACYNCEYLVAENKKEGNINGCLYYCTKAKKYVNGADNSCDNYNKDICRSTSTSNEIYNNGRHYYNGDNCPLILKIIFILILVIIALIANING